MKLQRSNYDNKEVINFLKESFSILESSESSFYYSLFLEADLMVKFKPGVYTVGLTSKILSGTNLSLKGGAQIKKEYTNRTEAIKSILRALKIIL